MEEGLKYGVEKPKCSETDHLAYHCRRRCKYYMHVSIITLLLTEEDKHKVVGELSNDSKGNNFRLATCMLEKNIVDTLVIIMPVYLSSYRVGM